VARQGRPAPRLAYITDGANHPKEYYKAGAAPHDDPCIRQKCVQWVVDSGMAAWATCIKWPSLVRRRAKAAQMVRPKWRRWLRADTQGFWPKVLRK